MIRETILVFLAWSREKYKAEVASFASLVVGSP